MIELKIVFSNTNIVSGDKKTKEEFNDELFNLIG